MLLHNHLDMIGRNEPIQRKAKFWQSYVRALKGNNYGKSERSVNFSHSKFHSVGTDDIRAPEATHYSRYPSSRGIFRPILDSFPTWPTTKSIFDDPISATDRIGAAGYRYLPISRETYGLTPRNIYPHHYSSLNRTPRLGDQDYETRHQGEFRHDEEGHYQFEYYTPPCSWEPYEGRQHDQRHLNPQYRRASERPFVKEYTIGPDGAKVPLYTHSGLVNCTIKCVYLKPYVSHIWDSSYWPRYYWPRSIWPRSYWPRSYCPRSYWPRSYLHRQPIYSRGGFTKKYIPDLYTPHNSIPLSRFDRDSWWWRYPTAKPFEAPYIPMNRSPFFLRDSFLSPVKNTYLWQDHPIRPFSTSPRLNF